jgi:hypothetical protein
MGTIIQVIDKDNDEKSASVSFSSYPNDNASLVHLAELFANKDAWHRITIVQEPAEVPDGMSLSERFALGMNEGTLFEGTTYGAN